MSTILEARPETATPALFGYHTSGGLIKIPPHAALIDDLLLDIAAGNERIAISQPPQTGKSTLCSHYGPAWYLGNWPTNRWMLAAYEEDFAEGWSGMARDLIVEHGAAFSTHIKPGNASRGRWKTAAGGGMIAAGIGGSFTGRGADVFSIDDPIKDDKHAFSEKYRDGVWEWYLSTAYSRLQPRGSVLVVMTRWHEDDLIGRLIANEGRVEDGGRWRIYSLPAICDDPDTDLLGRKEGEALWPARFDEAHYAEVRKVVGAYWWQTMYQQRPVRIGGNLVSHEWFKRYKLHARRLVTADGKNVSLDSCFIFATVDLAAGKDNQGDWTVCTSFALAPERDLFVLDVRRDRISGPRQRTLVQQAYGTWQHHRIGVESVAYQVTLVQDLKVMGLPVEALYPNGDKVAMFLGAAARYEQGQIYHPYPADCGWVPALESELIAFPNGAHDDQVDTVSMATTWVPKLGTTSSTEDGGAVRRQPDVPLSTVQHF